MIVCPNCNHQNPEGSTQCENCYTPLPQTTSCPNCGASVQTDATFCGQCGFNLQVEMIESIMDLSENAEEYPEITYTAETEPISTMSAAAISSSLQSPWDEDENQSVDTPEEINSWQTRDTGVMNSEQSQSEAPVAIDSPWDNEESSEELPDFSDSEEIVNLANSFEDSLNSSNTEDELFSSFPSPPEESLDSVNQEEQLPFSVSSLEPEASISPAESSFPSPSESEEVISPAESSFPSSSNMKLTESEPATPPSSVYGLDSATQLQIQTAQLWHVQTDTRLEIPPNLAVVHIGKPNSQIPPDIDVSGFENSDIVSRIHADIRVEGDAYFIEDVGSSNGTYINHSPLLVGNRHRLRSGDRIALGKGDLVTFIFQLS